MAHMEMPSEKALYGLYSVPCPIRDIVSRAATHAEEGAVCQSCCVAKSSWSAGFADAYKSSSDREHHIRFRMKYGGEYVRTEGDFPVYMELPGACSG